MVLLFVDTCVKQINPTMRIKQTLLSFLLVFSFATQLFSQQTESFKNRKIVVLGSSVAAGWVTSYQEKYDMQNGYAYRLARLLQPRGWEVINISIPGFDTKGTIERFEGDVLPMEPGYVIIGLSMSNEGLESGDPDSVSLSYESGIRKLIGLCRENNIRPVVGLCYSNDNYTNEQYAYLKKMNRLIASWDVPSINFLGALDDGHGHFPEGYTFDPNHPDDRGHEEMFYAIVPDIFEALEAGKAATLPVRSDAEMLPLSGQVITYVPSDVMHSFSLCFKFKTDGRANLISVKTPNAQNIVSVSANGMLAYEDEEIKIGSGEKHHLTFTHQYLTESTIIYLDGKAVFKVHEQLEPLCFSIGDKNSSLEISNLLIYRAALNKEEVASLKEENWFNGSLEVASLISENDFLIEGHILTNHALSHGNANLLQQDLDNDISALQIKLMEAEEARRNELRVEHRKAIEIDPTTLDQYEGSYEVEPGDNLVILKEENALYLDDHGRKAELLPEGNDRFFIHYPGDILVIFQRDENGNISGLIFSINGREMPARKLTL